MVLVDLALLQTLRAELDVGRELSASGLLAQNLGNLDRLLLQRGGHSGQNVTNGPGCGDGLVGDAATEKLGESLDELERGRGLAQCLHTCEKKRNVQQI